MHICRPRRPQGRKGPRQSASGLPEGMRRSPTAPGHAAGRSRITRVCGINSTNTVQRCRATPSHSRLRPLSTPMGRIRLRTVRPCKAALACTARINRIRSRRAQDRTAARQGISPERGSNSRATRHALHPTRKLNYTVDARKESRSGSESRRAAVDRISISQAGRPASASAVAIPTVTFDQGALSRTETSW